MSKTYGKTIYMDEEEEVNIRVRKVMTKISNDEYDDRFNFSIMAIILGGQDVTTLPKNKYGKRLQIEFDEFIDQRRLNLSSIVYDENWVSYLDCLENSRSIQGVINWINLLKTNSDKENVVDFLKYRNAIIKLIDDIEPTVKEGSVRGLRERVRKMNDELGINGKNVFM